MQPELYGQQLGLGETHVDRTIVAMLTPAILLTLPIPWDVQCDEQQSVFYFVHCGFEPPVSTWDHPLRKLHGDLALAMRRGASSGQLRDQDVRAELSELIRQTAGHGGVADFGIWERSTTGGYVERRTGQKRNDDPRMAAASYVGLSLVAIRMTWEAVSGTGSEDSVFPLSEAEIWQLAHRSGATVCRGR
jgi:hypothetical protein